MKIAIENALGPDIETLFKIERECFKEEAFSKQEIAHFLSDYNSICLIAKENGQIVGFIIGTIYVQRNSITGHILTVDVSPNYRQRRVGMLLLQEIERIFKERGATTCHLEVKEDNIAALRLYEKLGYGKIGILRNYYGKTHGQHLAKTLT